MTAKPTLHFIDKSSRNRADLSRLGFALGHHCEVYGGLSELAMHPPRTGLIVANDTIAEGGTVQVFNRLNRLGIWLPLIVIDESPQPERIVAAIKSGALDYLQMPIDREKFESCLEVVAREAESFESARRKMIEARQRIASLSNREREVLDWLTEGSSNKVIARQLDISPRTVEIHRANMMNKLGARHAAEAVRLRLEANLDRQMAG